MTRFVLQAGRYTILVAITVAATLVMWWSSHRSDHATPLSTDDQVAPAPLASAPKTPVYASRAQAEPRDVTVRYSGKIRAWETYSLGFEIAGRVSELGKNPEGGDLDDGDRVEAGQVLARLDDRILRARQSEAVAQFELATSDHERSRQVRQLSPGALTEAEYQDDLTQMTLAKARQEIAVKNLEDAILRSPIRGSIVRRHVEVGESVNPHAMIYEVVENDKLRLVVNVPESRVRELELRRRAVEAARAAGQSGHDAVFRADVRLEGADMYGKPWPSIEAEVYQIAEAADETTGLFEVEVLIPNQDGLLRPGMVATANLVTDRILAYTAPESAVLFRAEGAYFFSLEPRKTPMKVMFWDLGDTEVFRARRIALTDWIDQGETILLPADAYQFDSIITRGQQRLRDGQLVRVATP